MLSGWFGPLGSACNMSPTIRRMYVHWLSLGPKDPWNLRPVLTPEEAKIANRGLTRAKSDEVRENERVLRELLW